MSDFAEDPVKYLTNVLDKNPIERAAEIIDDRARLLGIRKAGKEVLSPEELAKRRANYQRRIDQMRKEFWTTNPNDLRKQVAAMKVGDFPELQPAVDRLKQVSAFRLEFEELGRHPAKHDSLFVALKRIVMLPRREAGSVKESFLRRIAAGKDLKKIQAMVSVIKKKFPRIYELESDWLETITRVKGRYVEPESQSAGMSMEWEIPGWLIGIVILLVIRVLALLF